MATANAKWIKHPGFYIKEEMEERGWLQRDLAFVLGCPEQAITMILAGKRSITPDMAKALGEAFDINPETFANLQKAYDMAHAEEPDPGVALRARLQNNYPVREMIKRAWVRQQADPAMLELQLMRFFEVSDSEEIPYYAHAAKKSRYEERAIAPAQVAWLFRVRQIARSISVPTFSERKLRGALYDLERLMLAPDSTREVPRIMMECGIRFIIVEKLPKSEIDGVCFWLEDSPVIGMSTQHDRIDNFWFVLRHEIEHVLQQHGRDEEIIDAELDGERGGTGTDLPEEERIANEAAANFCAPTDKLSSFLQRKHPYYYEKDVLAFARIHNRHPGIVVGQIRRRLNRYDYLTRYLVKIRQFVLPASISDGWGQAFPATL
jgi:HTH-type transcriptional regulator/antitoxin HigA